MTQRLCASTLLLLLLPLLTSSQTTNCVPGSNCSPPDCRCWNDEAIPGGVPEKETPQVVLLTFEYAINGANADLYRSLFAGAMNPNNCSAVGTFFVQDINSDFIMIKSLYDEGHEIGLTSADGTVPETEQEWRGSFTQVRNKLVQAGIPEQAVLGVRAPNLRPGGVEEFTALAQENLLYDASCSTSTFTDESSLLWPYTYDHAPGPTCDNGEGPEAEFPGKWQVVVADLEFNGVKCATPAACTAVSSKQEAFDLLYNGFIKHYEGRRSPFMVVINPEWVAIDFKREGTIEFVNYVRAAFEDTWILSVRQALEWVRSPVNSEEAKGDYPPWSCV